MFVEFEIRVPLLRGCYRYGAIPGDIATPEIIFPTIEANVRADTGRSLERISDMPFIMLSILLVVRSIMPLMESHTRPSKYII